MENQLITLVVTAVIVVIIFANFAGGGTSKRRQKSQYKYFRKKYLVTRTESEFFNVLNDIVGGTYYVFPQVHLSAILDHRVKGQPWKAAFRSINGKSVDYVLCEKASLSPVAAIELDDWSHGSKARQVRDEKVEEMLRNAGLPLVRFENVNNLNRAEITQRISEAIRG